MFIIYILSAQLRVSVINIIMCPAELDERPRLPQVSVSDVLDLWMMYGHATVLGHAVYQIYG